MIRSTVQSAGILIAAMLLTAAPVAAQACLQDNVAGQNAEGRVALGRFQDAAGRPQSAYILLLPKPVCLNSDEPDARVESTKKIHIHSSNDKVHAAIQKLVGTTVGVRGNPYSAHTAHHHAPIVMDLSKIDRR